MEILENIKELGNKLENNLELKKLQDDFLKSNIGQIANIAIDLGLKALLPDKIENEVIEVKDALLTGGIEKGIDKAIENTIEIGKKALGIENREFNSVEEAQQTIKEGNLKNEVSKAIDDVLGNLINNKSISNNTGKIVEDRKELILENMEANVEEDFSNEIKAVGKIQKYIGNWEKYYSNKNIEGLTTEYNKIEKQMKKIMPLENLIKNVNKIRNINEIIKNNKNFDFSEVYLKLAENFNK